ncbi:aminotransferase [Infundibulicybe gibba]|nr:aminotransferase [Infundibulicybe gibba]
MAIGNGHATAIADLDASKLTITLADSLKPLPVPEDLAFGETKTDYMLIAHYNPASGWSAPEIKPYGPLTIDPFSSCLQYCTNIFEGMKAYLGPDGVPRLFRPDQNMQRFARSAERVALPMDTHTSGYSLYIRPTMIGTRASFGVAASDSATLYIVVSPTGPYFRTRNKTISLLAVGDIARSWPGGTGGHKLGLNYAPGFLPQRAAVKQGYDQNLWLLGEDKKITEAGAMNFFVVVKRDDGDLDVLTPPLDGTILPGVTRNSCMLILEAHSSGKITLPGVPPSTRIHVRDRILTMSDLSKWSAEDRLLEAFGVGTAVIVAPIGRIGFEGTDLVIQKSDSGLGQVGAALWKTITDIQTGVQKWDSWCIPCV